MTFSEALLNQFRLHPSMQAQDVMKECYQAAFGAEHLLADNDKVHICFQDEFSSVPAKDTSLCEWIGTDTCRINLSAWNWHNLPPEWLFQMFRLSAAPRHDGAKRFQQCLAEIQSLIETDKIPLPSTEWQAYKNQFEAEGMHSVHHSSIYREQEQPAYRVVDGSFCELLPLLLKMAILPTDQVSVVAVDGRSASGKTTLAEKLSAVTGAGIIHMDDFFLPPNLRTAERFAVPGGNVHYERFQQEVLPYLRDSAPFSYRRFDCSQMDYGESRQVKESQWRIVEGAYSQQPALQEYMDLRVFADVDKETQMQRIRRRNGAVRAEQFAARWIPLEEAYFSVCRIREKSDLVLHMGIQ